MVVKDAHSRRIWTAYLLADMLAVVLAYFSAMFLRFYSVWGEALFDRINRGLGVRDTADVGPALEAFYMDSAPRIILILMLTVCVLYALRDLYADRRFLLRRPVGADVIVANLIALGLFYAYFYLSRNVFHPRSFFATVVLLNVVSCLSLRGIAHWLLDQWRRRGGDICRVLVIGATREARLIADVVARFQPHGLRLAEHLCVGVGPESFHALMADVEGRCAKGDLGMLVLADKSFSVAQIMTFLELADRHDLPVKILSDRLDVVLLRARVRMDMISGSPLLHFAAPSQARRYRIVSRMVAYAISLPLVVLLLPLMGVIALAIRLTSRGPALFVQERIGINRMPFLMYKFRTMYMRSDEVQAQVEELNESAGVLFKARNDPRITPVGRLLRRYSLDELPQLFNVLRGEMVLIGPRPLPRRDFENYYENWHYGRHNGLPGLTCLWQVSGRSELDFQSMCILDVFYLRNQNWVLDLKIVLRTTAVVLFSEGAY